MALDWDENLVLAPPLDIEAVAAWKNNPLPDSDALVTRSWLLGAEKELARINNEIRKLELCRGALLAPVEVYRVALAPHKMLPVDILREIFLCAIQGSSPDLNSIVYPQIAMQLDIRLVLSRVCSHWRSVAFDAVKLWSDVRVDFGSGNTTHLLEVLDVWLSRSGQCPLTLHLGGTADDPRIAEQLTRYSNRFRALSIHCGNPLLTLPASTVDLLETLELHGDDRLVAMDELLASMTIFVCAPRLHRLALHDFTSNINLALCAIPWQQLTELYLRDTFPPPSQY
ncbi:hypothetical protein C8R44DRAFT_225207 [Mycena epipterygia]|nr:hypothetical protein C8R44DRAFT_225207 [Mycena epipterygia]